DIAQRVMRLALHPGTQTRLQRAVIRLEGAGGQRLAVLDGEDARLLAGDRDEDGSQLDGGGGAGGFVQSRRLPAGTPSAGPAEMAEEVAGPLGARRGEDLLRRTFLDDPAVI